VEIYTGTSGYIDFDIIGASAAYTPAAILRRNNAVDITLTVELADEQPTGIERWQAYIPLSETTVQDEFYVVWEVTVGVESVERQDHVTVVTPYITPDEAAVRFGWDLEDPLSPTYRDYDEIVVAEKISRFSIDRFTGKSFGVTRKTRDAYGQQTDSLVLGEEILVFEKLYENGELVLDISDPELKWLGNVEITETGSALRLVFPGYNIAESETKYVGSETGAFRLGYRYTTEGVFGFANVPEKVSESCLMLINDYLCKDSIWREKYLNDIELRDWKYKFEPQAYRGTGNLLVDQMLGDYVSVNMVVI
jgi:hypothetical protein